MRCGSIARTVDHDSHNILAVGVDDQFILDAVHLLIEMKEGLCSYKNSSDFEIMPLPIAGLMSQNPELLTAKMYKQVDVHAKALGYNLYAPFLTLSFIALHVIPEIKLTDLGLFSLNTNSFCNLTA